MRRFLLAGDSLALGVGASAPRYNLAGRIAADFPGVTLENVARKGARARDVPVQLEGARYAHYHAVLVTVGGNDIIRLTRVATFEAHLDEALHDAELMAPLVIVTTSANVGGAPIFPRPISVWLSRRSLAVRDATARMCRRHGAHFVNYVFAPRNDVFGRHPHRYYAADRVHPSDAAYALCYRILRSGSPLAHAADAAPSKA